MPKGHSRNRESIYVLDIHFSCDHKTAAIAQVNAKRFKSFSQYMRWLINEDAKRQQQASLKGTTPMSGTDQK